MITLTKDSLGKDSVVINISGNTEHVVSSFLRVFLANQRLTDKQLEVTTALAIKYAVYNAENIKEPYASQLLFSTENRKDICTSLGITSAHLNNTFLALCKKGILVKETDKYVIHPGILPNSILTFKFKIHDEPRPAGNSSSNGTEVTQKSSAADNKEPVYSGQEDDDQQEHDDGSIH